MKEVKIVTSEFELMWEVEEGSGYVSYLPRGPLGCFHPCIASRRQLDAVKEIISEGDGK